MQTSMVGLDDLVLEDKRVYPRTATHWQTVLSYYQAMRKGSIFPNLVLTRLDDQWIVLDGAHRVKAMKLLAKEKGEQNPPVRVEVVTCGNYDDAYVEAVKRNVKHGLAFGYFEKKQMAIRLHDKQGMTIKDMENVLEMPAAKIAEIYEKQPLTADGEKFAVKRPFTGIAERDPEAVRRLTPEVQRQFLGASQEKLVDQVIMLIVETLLDRTSKSLVQKMRKLKGLLEKLDF